MTEITYTRYSRTRERGACISAVTKLTQAEHEALHWLAVEQHISDYEYLRRLVRAAIATPSEPHAHETSHDAEYYS